MTLLKYILNSLNNFKGLIFGQLACILLIAIDGNLRPFIIKLLIDNMAQFELNNFILLTAIFISSQLLMIIANASYDWLGTIFHTNYRAFTAHKFFSEITNYNYRFFQETASGAITAKISDAFNIIPMIIFMAMKIFISFILFVAIAIFILAKIDKLFVIALLIWISLFISLIAIFYYKYEPLNNDYAKVRPKIYGFLADYFSNILTVKFFNNKNYEAKNFSEITDEFVSKSTKCGLFLRNYYALHGVIVAIYMCGVLMLLGYLALHKSISPGDFALIFMINYKISDLLFDIANSSREFVTNCGIVKNAIKLLDAKQQINNIKLLPLEKVKGNIEFSDIYFKYNSNNQMFENLNLTIKAGEKIGLVGYSGSGKSSLVKLLLKLYNLEKGVIKIDGINIQNISEFDLYQAVSLIEQEPLLFHRSIWENIKYGNIKASNDEVIQAAKQAKADEFINKLPEKYNSLVGERGVKLSGGQRQRIAIARTILKNSPIFIMDEATSQLDSITENFIQDSLNKITTNKTAIIIAHRLATLKQVDRIIMFDNGKIIEDGTREELLAKKGAFYKLWQAQKDGFLPEKR